MVFEQINILNFLLLLHEKHLRFKYLVTVNMHICFLRESSALPLHSFVWSFLFFSVVVDFSLLACLFAYLSVCLFHFVCLFICLFVC